MNVPANAGRLSATMPLAVLAITDQQLSLHIRPRWIGWLFAGYATVIWINRAIQRRTAGPPVAQVCLRAYEMAAVSEGLAITLHRRRWRRRYGIRKFCR
jgi:drug/metabolite transporter (DMT)-like permease